MELEQSYYKATILYKRGYAWKMSTGICGNVTAGFGKLNEYGYFQYPLDVNQETYEVSTWEEKGLC